MVMRTQRVLAWLVAAVLIAVAGRAEATQKFGPLEISGESAVAAVDTAPRHRQVRLHPAAQHDACARGLGVDEAGRQVVRPLRPFRSGSRAPISSCCTAASTTASTTTRRASPMGRRSKARRSTSASTISMTTAKDARDALKFRELAA